MFETVENIASRYDAHALEATVAAMTGETAHAGSPRQDFGALHIPVTSAGITFLTRPDGTVDRVAGRCKACGRSQSAGVIHGDGYGTGPVPAFRHLRRILNQPARGLIGRALARSFGCACRTRLF